MITVKRSDITKEDVEVIVNAANTRLAGGGGVDGAIHRSAGPCVMEECKVIGGCKTGEAVITNAGALKANKIIHTPGPVWRGGENDERKLLKSCYKNSLILAKKNNLKTIAFPAISAGIYGYPIEEAAEIALKAGLEFEKDFDEIIFVTFSEEDFDVYKQVWDRVK
ncbi:MAG: O-acetyl-ADP-ribose deacetylase [Candidatus Omnitrophota bacterium]